MIPFNGIKRQYKEMRDEILSVTDSVYASGEMLDGKFTHQFEKMIADRCDRKFAIAVNSCTQGLIFALNNYKKKNILVPNLSFAATMNAVRMSDNNAYICEVDHYGIIDLDSLDKSMSHYNIDVIMYVNLFGNVIDYAKLKTHTDFFGNSPFIIEDAAQSFGAKYKNIPSGKLGDVSVLSFDPTKNLANYGSGGMLLTDDDEIASLFYNIRDNGKSSNFVYTGSNSKMSEVDCAQLIVKLKYFDGWQQRRAAIAEYYSKNLSDAIERPIYSDDVTPSWHKYVTKMPNHKFRNEIKSHLAKLGIETKIHYEYTIDDLYPTTFVSGVTAQPNSIEYRDCGLSLPIHPELTDGEVDYILTSINNYIKLAT